MAFGYEMLHGRQGAAGYCREESGETVIRAKGFKPGERYVLHALLPDRIEQLSEKTADSSGQAVFRCFAGNPVFVAVNGKPCLWQGGEENYLRASEELKKLKKKEQTKTGETPKDISPEIKNEPTEQPAEVPQEIQKILSRDLEEIQLDPNPMEDVSAEEMTQEELPPEHATAEEPTQEPESILHEPEPEPPYTLRSPSDKEPVDALPD